MLFRVPFQVLATQTMLSILTSIPIGYYRLILCRFHPLADKVHVAVHKVYNAVVVLGIGIVQATTLHHLQCLQGNLHRFYALAVNGGG